MNDRFENDRFLITAQQRLARRPTPSLSSPEPAFYSLASQTITAFAMSTVDMVRAHHVPKRQRMAEDHAHS